jgi:hypothetical protein
MADGPPRRGRSVARPVSVGVVLAAAAMGCWTSTPGAEHDLVHFEWEARPVRRVDVLLVVDVSPTMAHEQAVIPERIAAMVRTMVLPPDVDGDGLPDISAIQDLNLAVISSNLGTLGYPVPGCDGGGDDGCFFRTSGTADPSCTAISRRFVSCQEGFCDGEGAATAAGCLATREATGCSWSQPLAAALRGLDRQARPGGCNQGFLRPDSQLLVLVVTDQDDCSLAPAHPEMVDPDAPLGPLATRCHLHPELLTPIDRLVEELLALRTERPDFVGVGIIAGFPNVSACSRSGDDLFACAALDEMRPRADPEAPGTIAASCRTETASAVPPVRLLAAARALGAAARTESICGTDWSEVTRWLTDELADRDLPPEVVLPRSLPVDPATCSPACLVVETLWNDRPCPEDPTCPSADCPAVEADPAWAPPPCVDPETGTTCRPLFRDLGTETEPDGDRRRRCLVRPDEGVALADGCFPPEPITGWYYADREPGPDGRPGTPDDDRTPRLRSFPSGSRGSRVDFDCRTSLPSE